LQQAAKASKDAEAKVVAEAKRAAASPASTDPKRGAASGPEHDAKRETKSDEKRTARTAQISGAESKPILGVVGKFNADSVKEALTKSETLKQGLQSCRVYVEGQACSLEEASKSGKEIQKYQLVFREQGQQPVQLDIDRQGRCCVMSQVTEVGLRKAIQFYKAAKYESLEILEGLSSTVGPAGGELTERALAFVLLVAHHMVPHDAAGHEITEVGQLMGGDSQNAKRRMAAKLKQLGVAEDDPRFKRLAKLSVMQSQSSSTAPSKGTGSSGASTETPASPDVGGSSARARMVAR